MTRLAASLVISAAGLWGCGGSLTAPDAVPQRPSVSADLATISGQVYDGSDPVYGPIAGALVKVTAGDGSGTVVTADEQGFYRASIVRGSVTITASKDGYEAKQWQFDLLNDVVLNFSLSPQ